MQKVVSFNVDHTKLKAGLYESKKQELYSGSIVKTYDLRFTTPYKDKPMNSAALHAIEHMFAYVMRNCVELPTEVIYVGPMGCRTGYYMVVEGDYDIQSIQRYLIDVIEECLNLSQVPYATKSQCGNYKFMDFRKARRYLSSYLEVLKNLNETNTKYQYL